MLRVVLMLVVVLLVTMVVMATTWASPGRCRTAPSDRMTSKLLDRPVLTKVPLVDAAIVVDVLVGVFLRDRTSGTEWINDLGKAIALVRGERPADEAVRFVDAERRSVRAGRACPGRRWAQRGRMNGRAVAVTLPALLDHHHRVGSLVEGRRRRDRPGWRHSAAVE